METAQEAEIDLRQLILRLWHGWPTLLLTSVVAVAIGVVLFFSVSRTFESIVEISPISQTDYDLYIDLATRSPLPESLQEKLNKYQQGKSNGDAQLATAFSYTRSDLLREFIIYLESPLHLMQAVKESGIARRSDSQETTDEAALNFIRSVNFVPATDKKPIFSMRVTAGDETALNRFVAWVLDNTSIEVAKKIRASVVGKIEASERMRMDAVASLKIAIASRRKQQESNRQDAIARLAEQAKIAETVGIKTPVTIPALNSQMQNVPVASAQVIDAQQPPYFEGTTVLNEQIEIYKTRKDDDPFTADLRELERSVYLLENDGHAASLRALLDQSPLQNPETAPIARYSTTSARAVKISPRASFFGAVSLLLGLLAGVGIVLLRQETKQS